ncbi:MAG: LysM peptidoglycan-binding domain-containing protein [Longimonas sp.]|uniref:LysM peptidoglycan-binding domain-containing protein n=1 Tax=Longimonas sp. TaxID=2039626 RepID=UPI003363989D
MTFSRSLGALCVITFCFSLVLTGCTSSESDEPVPAATVADTTTAEDTLSSITATAPSPDGERTLDERLADLSLAAEVKKALARDRQLRGYDFEAIVEQGTVLLKGDVGSESEHDRAARVVAQVGSVRAVTNAVTIVGQPVVADAGDGNAAREGTRHVVQSGETLWSIARSHQSSVDRIRQHNRLNDGRLQPGQELEIPEP